MCPLASNLFRFHLKFKMARKILVIAIIVNF